MQRIKPSDRQEARERKKGDKNTQSTDLSVIVVTESQFTGNK